MLDVDMLDEQYDDDDLEALTAELAELEQYCSNSPRRAAAEGKAEQKARDGAAAPLGGAKQAKVQAITEAEENPHQPESIAPAVASTQQASPEDMLEAVHAHE